MPPTTQPSSGNAGTLRVLGETTVVKPPNPPKPLTRAQKLAKALKECKVFKKKSKRKSCEKNAYKKYGPIKKKTSKKAPNGHKAAKARRATSTSTRGSRP